MFLGGSAARWLQTSPDIIVICVDPWLDGWAGDYAAKYGNSEFQDQLNAKEGLFQTFLVNLSACSSRVIPVRDASPEALLKLFLLGVQPDLVFLDATKTIDDLLVCHQLWPSAILTGDDWSWELEGDFLAKDAVIKFASKHGFEVIHKRQSWLIVKEPERDPQTVG